MGLIRYYHPIGDGAHSGGSTPALLSNFYTTIDDPRGSYTARGTSGGVETDVADDTDYINNTGAFPGRSVFQFNQFLGSDDISGIHFHIRAKIAPSADSGINIVHYKNSTATETVVHTVAPGVITTSFANHDFPWDEAPLPVLANLDPTDDWFGINNTNTPARTISISRFYLAVHGTVGSTLGRDYRQENWRFCDVCGTKEVYSRIARPVAPHPQAGLAVCQRCYDEPDHDTIMVQSRRVPREFDDVLY